MFKVATTLKAKSAVNFKRPVIFSLKLDGVVPIFLPRSFLSSRVFQCNLLKLHFLLQLSPFLYSFWKRANTFLSILENNIFKTEIKNYN